MLLRRLNSATQQVDLHFFKRYPVVQFRRRISGTTGTASVESSRFSLRSRIEQDRRHNPRYPFNGSSEMRAGASRDMRTARVNVLSLSGCCVVTESPYHIV